MSQQLDFSPLVTIIIPVYNTALYLTRCLDSIFLYPLDDLEVIAVDDGSTDDSCRILLEYRERESRLQIIHQSNAGVAAARNNGLCYAKGKYVYFVDSDDYVIPDGLFRVFRHVEQCTEDIVIFGMERENLSGKVISRFVPRGSSDLGTGKQLQASFSEMYFSGLVLSACNKLFLRDFLLNYELTFPLLRIGEDATFCLRALRIASSVSIISVAVYRYCERRGSAMVKFREYRLPEELLVYQELCKLSTDWGITRLVAEHFLVTCGTHNVLQAWSSCCHSRKGFSILRKNDEYRCALENCPGMLMRAFSRLDWKMVIKCLIVHAVWRV